MNATPPTFTLPEPAVEVYRSLRRSECEERAFMLHAVGIASQVIALDRHWSLVVTADTAPDAQAHLRRYEHENPPRRRFVSRYEPLHPYAWVGPLLYALVLVLVGYLAGRKAFATDWLDVGTLHGALLRGDEPWRAITALTLHFDIAHLLGNLGFGAFFGWLAGQLLGPGVAFGAAVAAAALANLCNGTIQDAEYVSAGASTAVFAMLGLLAAYAWKRRAAEGGRWAYRWAPLIAGVCLLGFTGVGGERTGVGAHLGGFFAGGIAGLLLALRLQTPGRLAQWATGLATLAAVAVAWFFALQ